MSTMAPPAKKSATRKSPKNKAKTTRKIVGDTLVETQFSVDGDATETRTKLEKTPAIRLKRLRERAGFTMQQTADYLAYAGATKGSGLSTYQRYESPVQHGSGKIRAVVIEKLLRFFVGRGNPPISEDDLIPLAAMPRASGDAARRLLASAGGDHGFTQALVSPIFSQGAHGVHLLTVLYRAERGVYMDEETIDERSFGIGNITAANDYRAEDQFTVLVADGHASRTYVLGSQLHCVKPSAVSMADMQGKRVAFKVRKPEVGLAEVVVGVVHRADGNQVEVRAMDGKKLDGEVLGLVIGRYSRE